MAAARSQHPIKHDGRIDAIEHIKIYDVLGYFQKPFADVVDDMLKRKMANEYEQTLIKEMKARRGDFANEVIERITEYCLTECRLLSKQMGQLRQMILISGLGRSHGMGRGRWRAPFSARKRSPGISASISRLPTFPLNRIGRIMPLSAAGSRHSSKAM